MPRIVKFFETTLRDGEQTPGINYFAEEKLEIARALADMGFDTLDCGFAISGEPEFEAIRLIARNVHNAEICSIARCYPDDIDRAWEAVKDAEQSSIHPFISTSPLHREVEAGQDARRGAGDGAHGGGARSPVHRRTWTSRWKTRRAPNTTSSSKSWTR